MLLLFAHAHPHHIDKTQQMKNEVIADHLVILPCHSIWKPGMTCGVLKDEWVLAPFQVEGNDHMCFREHIERSINVLNKDPRAVLVISGGQTKEESGPVLESYSYYQLGCTLMPAEFKSHSKRIVLEEFARDSFENVLFLICRYFEVLGYYPSFITVVGFEFKRPRFVEQHLKQALSFPEASIRYIGNNPDPAHLDEEGKSKYFSDLKANEIRHARNHFEVDWYGVRAPLSTKKALRDPFLRSHGYAFSNRSIGAFLIAIGKTNEPETNENIRDLLKFPWRE